MKEKDDNKNEPDSEIRTRETDGEITGKNYEDWNFERLWNSLSHNQKKVAEAYVFLPTKAEAAKEVGLKPSGVYRWDERTWIASERLTDKRAEGIQKGISALSAQAIRILQKTLNPDEEVDRVESETAQYIINQLEGKPTRRQKVEHSGNVGVEDIDEDDIDLSHLEDAEEADFEVVDNDDSRENT